MRHKNYFFVVLFGIATCVPGIFLAGIYLQPLSGDLARMAWVSERDFGWNAPQKQFEYELNGSGDYTGYRDVVVIGDSFSTNRTGYQWQEFFADLTGWSVATFPWDGVKLEDVLANPVFKAQPPRLVILEAVERQLIVDNFFSKQPGGCASPGGSAAPSGWAFAPAPRPLKPVARTSGYGFGAINPGYVRQYLFNAVKRRLLPDDDSPKVYRLALTKDSLFSSRVSDTLLVYRRDVGKLGWQAEDYEKIRCTIRGLQRRVESNGKTVFVLMIVPDKLTAYADYLADEKLRNLSRLDIFAADGAIRFPRIDSAIRQAVRSGNIDVYLPDDTHWGYVGHQTAANALVDYLQALAASSSK